MFDSQEELLRHIRLGEDSRLELKAVHFRGDRVARPGRDLADELAAMGNTADAVLILGVDDKTRDVTGIPPGRLDEVESYVREICHDSIKPPLPIRISRMELPDETGDARAVLRVDVPRSLFVHQSPGGYFDRQGSSKREMPPERLARLFQQRSQARLIRFDEQTAPGTTPNSLSPDLWKRFRTDLSPADDDEFLGKLGLLAKDDGGTIRATVTGVLLATERPEEWITNAFIQAVCYKGKERNAAYQVDQKNITGPVDQQVRDACRFVEKNMSVAAEKSPGRIEMPQYSMNAVFEAVVNAIAHRDYSVSVSKIRLHLFADRLELFSPGTIPNTLTIDSLPLRQATRNELLTSLLARCPVEIEGIGTKRQFLMDRRGEGVPIILSESEALSGRRPEYRLIDDAELLLTVFAAGS